MFKLLASTALAVVLLSTPVSAEESYIESLPDGNMKIALNNVHHEMAECAAYYRLSEAGMRKRGDEESISLANHQYKTLIILLQRANILHREETTIARMEMALKIMYEEMHDSWSNFSIVINKYTWRCKEVLENPEKRIRFYFDKANNEN